MACSHRRQDETDETRQFCLVRDSFDSSASAVWTSYCKYSYLLTYLLTYLPNCTALLTTSPNSALRQLYQTFFTFTDQRWTHSEMIARQDVLYITLLAFHRYRLDRQLYRCSWGLSTCVPTYRRSVRDTVFHRANQNRTLQAGVDRSLSDWVVSWVTAEPVVLKPICRHSAAETTHTHARWLQTPVTWPVPILGALSVNWQPNTDRYVRNIARWTDVRDGSVLKRGQTDPSDLLVFCFLRWGKTVP